MAITKIIGAIHPPSKGSRHKVLRNTIDYILDPEKTENGRLIGSIGCFPNNALQQMLLTQHQYGKDKNNYGAHERLGYHFTISFSPEENISPEVALQVMKDFSEELTKKQYEAVYSVHTDKEHIHGHLCFNSVNYYTGKKYCYRDGDWAKIIQPITDKVCLKYGLHTLEMDTGKSIEEYEKEEKERERRRYYERIKNKENREFKKRGYHKDGKENYSWNDHLRLILDDIVLNCTSMDEFYKQLKKREIEVKSGTSKKHGAYIGLKAPGMEISRRTYQLGKEYTLDGLQKRIEMRNKPLPEYQVPDNMILVVPVQFYSKVKRKNILSNEMRRYYARLYRLGIKPRSRKITYQDVKNAREKASQMQRELELVIGNRIGSQDDAERLEKNCRNALEQVETEIKGCKAKHSDYDMVVKKYRWYLKQKKIAEGKLMKSETENNRLKEAKQEFEKYGFSEADIEKYLQQKSEEKKMLLQKRKEAERELEAAKQICHDMELMEQEEDMTQDEYLFWKSIPDLEEQEQKLNKEGKRI